MNKKDFENALRNVRALSKKRKFDQSLEMSVNFKGIDFKKAENRIELDVKMPHPTGRLTSVKSVVFVKDKNFAQELKGKVSKIIMESDIAGLKKKDVDEIIRDYNIFLAEGPALITVGKHLGQQLAPKGRMPSLVQTNVASVEAALKRTSTSTKITNKKGKFMPVVHVMLGKESFPDAQLIENAYEIYTSIISKLSAKEANIKSVILKFSMGQPIKIGEKYDTALKERPAKEAVKGGAQ
ncbi:MAG: hypothetical protein NUV67_04480 [archaeon]|nr:hypothetical protein [archaeon]